MLTLRDEKAEYKQNKQGGNSSGHTKQPRERSTKNAEQVNELREHCKADCFTNRPILCVENKINNQENRPNSTSSNE